TYRAGGAAEWLAAPRTLEDIRRSLRWAQERQLPVTMIGAGSNLLVSDQGVPGLVITTRHWRQTEFDPATGQVTAAAGEPLPTLAWKAAKRGWRGLEWAVGIPGTVGGAVFMNAGAHGIETADILVRAWLLETDLSSASPQRLIPVGPEQLGYRYRTSILQTHPRPVLRATFQLEPGHDPKAVMADTQADLEQRRATQPYDKPSCGSVFRNPKPHSAGWLIEQSGLKGYRIGNAQVADRHANFIINCGGAKAADILRLIRHVQQRVADQWACELEAEVRLLGQFSDAEFPPSARIG
ncbi:UDP-N-acetylenolpyruvoylglucosamine reductase, partial [filamentous cyanobacterium CCP5]